MFKFKLFNNFNTKKKIALIALLIFALLLMLGNYNREVIKSYINEVATSPSTRIHLINIAKVAIPLKNLILMRNVDDKIALLESSGSCVFCDLTQGNFKGIDLKGFDLRYAVLIGADLSNTNLTGAILNGANLSGANLDGVDLSYTDLAGVNLSGVDLSNKDLTGTRLRKANLSGANLDGVDLSNNDFTEVNLSGIDLSNKNFTGTNLSRVDLSNNDLTGTNLTFTNLRGANLDGVDLSNKDFTGANLTEFDFSNKDLTGTRFRKTNLSGANLDGVDLTNMDFTGANLTGVDLSNKDLTGTILLKAILSGANLDGVDLSNKDLTGANLTGVDLSNKDLTGTILTFAYLLGANLDGVDLSNKDLTGANLTGVDLSNKDLTGTILLNANLSGANLNGVDLSNKDLTGANLTGVDLSDNDLTGTIFKDAKKIEMSLKDLNNSNWPSLNENQNLFVTRYDLSGDVQYLATRNGFLFESKNNESRLVLDLNNDAQFPFITDGEGGFLSIASQNKLVYVSYTSKDINGVISLVVDEYSMNFSKVRNIIKLVDFKVHYGGNIVFDSLGKLYLSVGDGGDPETAQDLNSLRGKILRLDISDLRLEPEIVAYGIRNPWGTTIDSKDRMFINSCGGSQVEAVWLLNDLYSGIPANFGWPVFEGSKKIRQDPLMFKDVSAPIFETNIRPGCLIAGVYLNHMESLLLGDFYGTIRLLKQQENGDWYLLHEYKQEKNIIGFGLDKKTKKIFVAPNNLELEILVDQVNPSQ